MRCRLLTLIALGVHGVSAQNESSTCAATDSKAEITETVDTEWGEPQVVLNIYRDETRTNILETQRYITTHSSWKQTCLNHHQLCSYWAATNECTSNADYMKSYCAPSCKSCDVPELNPQEAAKAALLNASVADNATAIMVATAFGEAQYVPTMNADPVVQAIAQATTYMHSLFQNETFANVRNECKSRHSRCSLWASEGECMRNEKYMSIMCAPICQTCEKITYEARCPFDKDAPTVWQKSGDLNRMFERIVRGYARYSPTVLSRPPEGPWVIQLDQFATKDECDRLIEYGKHIGYGDSVTVGKLRVDGTAEPVVSDSVRTSSTAWCQGGCEKDPVIIPLWQRIEDLVQIPQVNSEFLQLLRYEEGQFYRKHHDYLDHHQDRPQGPRILTVFLYLNDVEEGGETHFSNLNLSVKPKLGRAVIWPSVFDEDPNAKDSRTEHESLTVLKGIKYGANAWIHQRDYQTPHYASCA